MTDRRAKRNSQPSARVTQFYPLPPLIFTAFRVDPKARELFTTTTTMMREMEVELWSEKAEAELKELS